MQIPTEQNPIWEELISGESQHQFEFLGTKIILGRLRMRYRKCQSPQEVNKYVHELRTFFEKNLHLPKVQTDLKKVFGKEVI
jgi:hypothetical protein